MWVKEKELKKLLLRHHKDLLRWGRCTTGAPWVRGPKSKDYRVTPGVWSMHCGHYTKIWLAIGWKSVNKWLFVTSLLVNASDGWWAAWMFSAVCESLFANISTKWGARCPYCCKEVLSILPTNLGKCVIYPVFCFAKISKACVLSISLLNSILVEQVLKLNELGHLAV